MDPIGGSETARGQHFRNCPSFKTDEGQEMVSSDELSRLRLMETATVQGLRRQVSDLQRKLAYAESGPHGDCQG